MAEPLYVAMLVIYLILIQPALYCLWKHGKRGILGWFYVQSFCLIRIIGSALTIHDEATGIGSTTTLIVSSIGLSPLLLAAAGILHEARSYRNPRRNRKLEWFLVIQYHVLLSAALVMIVVAVVKLGEGKVTTTSSTLLKVGASITLLCWVLLIIWTFLSVRSSKADVHAPGYEAGTGLLQAVAIVLVPIGLRLIYAVTTLILEIDLSSSGFPKSLAAKVCLSVVPEMIATLVLIVAGIITRNITRSYSRVAVEGDRPAEQPFLLNNTTPKSAGS